MGGFTGLFRANFSTKYALRKKGRDVEALTIYLTEVYANGAGGEFLDWCFMVLNVELASVSIMFISESKKLYPLKRAFEILRSR